MRNIKLLTAFVVLFSTVLTVSSCKKDRDNDFQLGNQHMMNDHSAVSAERAGQPR